MALLTRFEVQGMPAETYEEVLRRLEAAGAGAPPGRLYHFAYGSPSSLQVVDVYDSPESMQSLGQTLVPILQEMGIQADPDVQEVYKTVVGRQAAPPPRGSIESPDTVPGALDLR